MLPSQPRPTVSRLAAVPALLLVSACAGGAGPGASSVPDRASDAEWRALATPRPSPLDGAARVSMVEVRILAAGAATPAGIDAGLAVQELASLGLLRRRDVRFVERRRFAEAAERERRGLPRTAGAPPAGVSPGAEFLASASWSSVGLDSSYVDVRVVEAATGRVVASWRGATGADADLPAVARRVVHGVLVALDELGRRPDWADPLPWAAPAAYRPSDLPAPAVDAFLAGLAAEERWDWEGARRGYQRALDQDPFPEAEAALARVARLRTGGTLAAS